MLQIPSRQVHLDFHTSEHIPVVGNLFDKKQFQDALKAGHVNSITVFAKCHHSWSYYPTDIGRIHPSLDFDLLGQQIEACHEIGVRVPIYYTVGWSANDAEDHPEWCVRKKDGTIHTTGWEADAEPDDRRPIVSWKFMCPTGGYRDLILKQTEEICQRYPVDGMFYDIVNGPLCYCDTCRQAMEKEGVDLDNLTEVVAFNDRKWKNFFAECHRVVREYYPQSTFFFNGTTLVYADAHNRDCSSGVHEYNTHQELEDLPTTWGGYDKLPIRAKYFHNTGKPLLGMSGKFHTTWGEFGGFKHPDAIRYEAAAMVAFGAGCSFGDQLHPSGRMDAKTYRIIGEAYRYVEQIEDYGIGGLPFSRLGLWRTGNQDEDEGVVNMLLETQTDFAVVEPEKDLLSYETIILPGAACLTAEQADLLNAFVKNGGSLLVLGEGALDSSKERFLLDVGATYLGPANFDTDFLEVGEKLGAGLVSSPFLNYQAAIRVEPDKDAEILAALREPYFDRTYAKYCSHQNTPYQLEQAKHPGALRKGKMIFLPHALGSLYLRHGARLHRDFFMNALRLVYTQPTVTTDMPSCGRLSFLHQPQHHRYVAHLLYAPPLQRGRCLVIDDIVPLYQIPLEIRVPQSIKKVSLIPDTQNLSFEQSGDVVKVVIPEFQCHCAVVLEY
jgi:hypothetical protein